ncbi:LysR family transcriptional regulator [Polynucleobacter sp. 78F-HAINBA]|jgi:DNA-binding transcriptional LysR family regulator|uniref:LysR family transcriptional regulator n=1 Tax=unclassified Polynucleobacter TaxID=2640945 RepID=UPI001C0C73F5|nr:MULTISPECIES: LysR family transcriptional regulator [unclassified Polynucleobacter]MBU3588432.1 LysR family transcriptional regulator [Polynucleobacter sp. 31A-FELB]MBU3592013.1 LysR family transcriptional regulator [Polynucleobacter sp. 78F-HAINBA]
MAKSINPADLGFFSTLISSGSLGAAARELGVTTAAVSKHLAQMESRLGLVLVNRTTRRMSLTHEGEIYLDHARRILGEIDDLEHMLWGSTKAPQGLLRVNATLGFGRSHIAPLIAEYVKQFPQVDIQLQLSVNPPPITDDAYDVCFRFGHPPDSRSIARLIAPNKRILVASPAYIKEYGEPKSPSELIKHNCIGIRQGDEGYGLWRFSSGKGKSKNEFTDSAKVRGNLTTNDGGIAVNWALDGRGIVLRAEWDVTQHLKSGRLIQVMKNFETPDADIYAVYAERHKTSVRVKTLIDFAIASFGAR